MEHFAFSTLIFILLDASCPMTCNLPTALHYSWQLAFACQLPEANSADIVRTKISMLTTASPTTAHFAG